MTPTTAITDSGRGVVKKHARVAEAPYSIVSYTDNERSLPTTNNISSSLNSVKVPSRDPLRSSAQSSGAKSSSFATGEDQPKPQQIFVPTCSKAVTDIVNNHFNTWLYRKQRQKAYAKQQNELVEQIAQTFEERLDGSNSMLLDLLTRIVMIPFECRELPHSGPWLVIQTRLAREGRWFPDISEYETQIMRIICTEEAVKLCKLRTAALRKTIDQANVT